MLGLVHVLVTGETVGTRIKHTTATNAAAISNVRIPFILSFQFTIIGARNSVRRDHVLHGKRWLGSCCLPPILQLTQRHAYAAWLFRWYYLDLRRWNGGSVGRQLLKVGRREDEAIIIFGREQLQICGVHLSRRCVEPDLRLGYSDCSRC